jgi:tetratricopeptide (TPR) repeat protein
MNTGLGTFIAFATAPGKTADDNPSGGNGLFTMHLLKSLKEEGIGLDDVFNKVRENVHRDSNGDQVPWIGSSVIGKFYFRPPSGKSVTNATPPLGAADALSTALRLRKQGKLRESLAAFDTLIAQYPSDPQPMFERGMLLAGMEQYDPAIRDFTRTIRLQPAHSVAYYARGLAYISKDEYAAALPDFERAAADLPRDAAVFFNRALALGHLGQDEAALASYNQALNIRPDYPAALVNRGLAYASLGDYEQALRDFDTLIRVMPTLAIAYSNRAKIRLQMGDELGAAQDEQAARELRR